MKLVSLLFVVTVGFSNAQTYQRCQTPNRVSGFCQPVKTCLSVIKMLEQQPIPPHVREHLRGLQCKQDSQPWVCCTDATGPTTRSPKVKLPVAPECGLDLQDRIFGGEVTKIYEFPWLVQLQYNKPGNKKGFHCGGSLINNRYVLTAAHCISKVPPTWKLTSVRLGEWDTNTDQDCDDSYTNEQVCNEPHVDVSVEEKIVHESYDSASKNQHNDIALLRLSRDVQYTDFIKPICLPAENSVRNLDLSKFALDVAGWGKTEVSPTSTKKLKVKVNAYSKLECQNVYARSNIQILDSQICAGGEPGRDSCNGDSGGPLMHFHEQGAIPYYFLAGIVSYGPRNCGTPDIPGVYTRTSAYIDWIQNNIRK